MPLRAIFTTMNTAMMRQIRKQKLTIVLLRALFCFWLAGFSQVQASSADVVTAIVTNSLTGIAIDGYDPVSYFTDRTPREGSPDFEYRWGGVSWYFATDANREIFKRAPEIYAPQFGGHCAMSMARGFLSDGNPRIYLVYEQRLYMFYSDGNRDAFLMAPEKAFLDSQKQWPELSKQLTVQ